MADQNLRVNITAFDKTQRAFASVRAGLGKVKSSVFNVRSAVVGLGATLALKQFAGQIDDLAKASGRLGVTVNELQALQFAAGQTGVSSDELTKGLERFSRSIGETAQGIGSAKEEFEQLGISVKNADGSLKPTTTLLNEVSDGLKNVGDPAERVRIAFDLFGRSGVKLINTLKGGSGELANLTSRFNELTLTLTEDQAKAVEGANDGFDRLAKTFTSFGQSITANVLPSILLIGEAFTVLGSLAIANIIDGVGTLRNKFLTLAQTFGLFRDAEKSAIGEGTSKRLREIAEGYALASGQVSNLADNVKKVGEEAAPAESAITKLAKVTETTSQKASETVASSFGDTFKSIILGTKQASEAFSDMATNIISRLFDILVVEKLVQSLAGAFGGAGSAPATPSKVKAIGGSVQRGVPTIVGERGAELFVPASSGSIVPNKEMAGNGITVVNNLTVNSDNAAAVRSQVLSMLPMIKEASKGAVLEASRRGGSFANSFGN